MIELRGQFILVFTSCIYYYVLYYYFFISFFTYEFRLYFIYYYLILFLDSIRPSFESALSVSRIGSASQSKWIKKVSGGIKNTITYLRKETH